jgi:hypothetical protein
MSPIIRIRQWNLIEVSSELIVFPSSPRELLRTSSLVRVAITMFLDLIDRLESDVFRALIAPKNKINERQIKAFCNQIKLSSGFLQPEEARDSSEESAMIACSRGEFTELKDQQLMVCQ